MWEGRLVTKRALHPLIWAHEFLDYCEQLLNLHEEKHDSNLTEVRS